MAEVDLVSGANWVKGLPGLKVESVLPHYGFVPTDEQKQAVAERELHAAMDVAINHRDSTQVSDALGLSSALVDHHAYLFKYFAKDTGVDLAVLDLDPRSFDDNVLRAANTRLGRAESAVNQAEEAFRVAESRRWWVDTSYMETTNWTDEAGVLQESSNWVSSGYEAGPDPGEVAAAQVRLDRASAEYGTAFGEVQRLVAERNAVIAHNTDLLARQESARESILAGLGDARPTNPGAAKWTFNLLLANEGWRQFLNRNWMEEFKDKFKKIMDGLPV